MSDASNVAKSLRERLGGNTEERLGKALSDLLENPLLTGAIGRAFDAREKASQAQEVALGALNIPSAADIERLTQAPALGLPPARGDRGRRRPPRPRARCRAASRRALSAIEEQLRTLIGKLEQGTSLRVRGPSARRKQSRAPAHQSPRREQSRESRKPKPKPAKRCR